MQDNSYNRSGRKRKYGSKPVKLNNGDVMISVEYVSGLAAKPYLVSHLQTQKIGSIVHVKAI